MDLKNMENKLNENVSAKKRGRPVTVNGVYVYDNKKYYEKFKEKTKEKILCECGCLINYFALSNHRKTSKHTLMLKVKQMENN